MLQAATTTACTATGLLLEDLGGDGRLLPKISSVLIFEKGHLRTCIARAKFSRWGRLMHSQHGTKTPDSDRWLSVVAILTGPRRYISSLS